MASYPCPHCGAGSVREDARGVGVCDGCGAEIVDPSAWSGAIAPSRVLTDDHAPVEMLVDRDGR